MKIKQPEATKTIGITSKQSLLGLRLVGWKSAISFADINFEFVFCFLDGVRKTSSIESISLKQDWIIPTTNISKSIKWCLWETYSHPYFRL